MAYTLVFNDAWRLKYFTYSRDGYSCTVFRSGGRLREGLGRGGRQKTHDLFPFCFIYLQRSCDVKIAKSVFLGYRPISLKDAKAQRYNAIHFWSEYDLVSSHRIWPLSRSVFVHDHLQHCTKNTGSVTSIIFIMINICYYVLVTPMQYKLTRVAKATLKCCWALSYHVGTFFSDVTFFA